MVKLQLLFKKIIMSFFTLYSYNVLVPSIAIIPINIITILIVTILSIPGLLALTIIKILIY